MLTPVTLADFVEVVFEMWCNAADNASNILTELFK